MQDTVDAIRNLIRKNRYSLKQHAHQRMTERGILTDDVEAVILLGDPIEHNPQNFPYPSFTFMRFVRGQPLYVVCVPVENWVYIITVHWYDPDKWTDPWTRKKPL